MLTVISCILLSSIFFFKCPFQFHTKYLSLFSLFSLQSVPQNTKSAITPTFYTYNPPTKGGNNYSSYYIRKPDYMVNLLIPEQDLQRQINAQEQEHHSEIAKLRQEKEVKFKETGVLISEKRQFEVCTG